MILVPLLPVLSLGVRSMTVLFRMTLFLMYCIWVNAHSLGDSDPRNGKLPALTLANKLQYLPNWGLLPLSRRVWSCDAA